MKISKLIILALSTLVLTCCATEKAPSEQGELMTAEQIKSLPADDSNNMKMASVEGYFGFCGKLNVVNIGKKNNVTITTEADCKGERVITASISVRNTGGIIIFGDEPNNFLAVKDKDVSNLTVVTDDYQSLDAQKLRFSGNLLYNNGEYTLDNVTIHAIK